MSAALNILGMRCYHWEEMLKHKDNRHLKLWLAALRAKYDGEGMHFRGYDFDRMLWDYDVRRSFV